MSSTAPPPSSSGKRSAAKHRRHASGGDVSEGVAEHLPLRLLEYKVRPANQAFFPNNAKAYSKLPSEASLRESADKVTQEKIDANQKEEETHLAVANQGDLFLKYHPENRKLLENPEGIWEDATAVAATSIPDKSSFAFCVAGAASGCTNRQRFDYLFSSWGSSGLSETPEMKAWAAANGKYMGLWSDLVKLNGNIKTRRWTEEILAHEPLTLDERAVKFVDGVVASDLPPKSKRARAGKDAAETPFTAGKIYSLVLPIDENTKFRLSRDCERKFTNDGRVLIFEVIGADNINRQAGVLDPASRQLRVRWPCPLKWDPAEGKGTRNDDSKAESLERAAVNMFTEMGVDPREFFNSMGQKHGMCMICGRPLTAAQSKKKGYGADCAKHVGWQYD